MEETDAEQQDDSSFTQQVEETPAPTAQGNIDFSYLDAENDAAGSQAILDYSD
jgi:hypothetical protein